MGLSVVKLAPAEYAITTTACRRGSQLSGCEGRFIYNLQKHLKQTKENGEADKLDLVQSLIFLRRCLFFPFFSPT